MSKKRPVDSWRAGSVHGRKLPEVNKELERLGFTVERTKKNHWKAFHPELVGCPAFPGGVVVFSAHAFGNQGEVHPQALRDIACAVDWIFGDENP